MIWHGEVAPEALPAQLSQAHVLVAVPDYESFGLTPFEAMACGLDLICTDTGAFDQATAQGQEGALLAFGDVDALCAALEACLVNPEATRARGARNRERAVQSFSIAQEAATVNALYHKLVVPRR